MFRIALSLFVMALSGLIPIAASAQEPDSYEDRKLAYALVLCGALATEAELDSARTFQEAGFAQLIDLPVDDDEERLHHFPSAYDVSERRAFVVGKIYAQLLSEVNYDLHERQRLPFPTSIGEQRMADYNAWEAERSAVAVRMFSEKNCNFILP